MSGFMDGFMKGHSFMQQSQDQDEDRKYIRKKRLSEDFAQRANAIMFTDTGEVRSEEELAAMPAYRDLLNHDLLKTARDRDTGKNVFVSGLEKNPAGEGYIPVMEWRDDKGNPISKGPLTVNGTNQDDDPVQPIGLGQLNEYIISEAMGDQAFAQSYREAQRRGKKNELTGNYLSEVEKQKAQQFEAQKKSSIGALNRATEIRQEQLVAQDSAAVDAARTGAMEEAEAKAEARRLSQPERDQRHRVVTERNARANDSIEGLNSQVAEFDQRIEEIRAEGGNYIGLMTGREALVARIQEKEKSLTKLVSGAEPDMDPEKVALNMQKELAEFRNKNPDKVIANLQRRIDEISKKKLNVLSGQNKKTLMQLHMLDPQAFTLEDLKQSWSTGKLPERIKSELVTLKDSLYEVTQTPDGKRRINTLVNGGGGEDETKAVEHEQKRFNLVQDKAKQHFQASVGNVKGRDGLVEQQLGEFIGALGATPGLEWWGLDGHDDAQMKVLIDAERARQADLRGSSPNIFERTFGAKSPSKPSLTPYIAKQFLGEQGGNIEKYYQLLGQEPGADVASVDQAIVAAVKLHNETGEPFDSIMQRMLGLGE